MGEVSYMQTMQGKSIILIVLGIIFSNFMALYFLDNGIKILTFASKKLQQLITKFSKREQILKQQYCQRNTTF